MSDDDIPKLFDINTKKAEYSEYTKLIFQVLKNDLLDYDNSHIIGNNSLQDIDDISE